MNAAELKAALAQVPDDTPIMMNQGGEYDTFKVENATAETNMTTGELVLTLVTAHEPESTSARDFEPHPAFESTINAWLWPDDDWELTERGPEPMLDKP